MDPRAGALLSVMVLACASPPRFVPASGVTRASTHPSGAVMRGGGITVIADADSWNADPPGLAASMTPIYVRVMNDSDESIAMRYASFRLATDLGEELRPLPPIAFDPARPRRPPARPELDAQRFRFAPYYRELFGDDVDCWTGGFLLDPYYYDRFGSWRAELPTAPMVQRALPEGVIEPGGWVAGFLYFDRVGPETARVTLHVDFDQPLGAERVASLAIPFVDGAS